MVRLAIVLVLACVGLAGAQTKRKIRIETAPPGAVVYLVEKEAGPACQPTPCSVEAPVGRTPVIIELKDHGPVFDNVTIPRRGKVPTAKFTLEPAVGKIIVEEPAGATVWIDEEDQGKAPVEIPVSADAHHVVVKLKGRKVYDGYVEVAAGAETTIKPDEVATEGGDEEVSDDEVDLEVKQKAKKSERAPRRDPFLRATAAVDIGFRTFEYNAGSNQRNEDELGQVLAGPMLEFWPGRAANIDALRGLSLMGRFQFGVNQQPVTSPTGDLGPKTATFWQGWEVSLRQRFVLKDKLALEPGAGFVRDQMQFSGTAADIAKLPDATYSSVRIGLRASVLLGLVEPFVSVEPRIVLSGGKLQNRYDSGSGASGWRAGGGALFRFGGVVGRLEVSTTRYAWTFTTTDPEITMTNSASDAVIQIGIGAGYQY